MKIKMARTVISAQEDLKTLEIPCSSDFPSSAQRKRVTAPFIEAVMNEKDAMMLATTENAPKSETPSVFRIKRDAYRFKISEIAVRM